MRLCYVSVETILLEQGWINEHKLRDIMISNPSLYVISSID